MVQQCTIKIRLYAEAGDTTREPRRDLGYGRREGSRRQVPGLAIIRRRKTSSDVQEKENDRPHPERDFLDFRLLCTSSSAERGDEESRGHLTLSLIHI